MPLLSATTLVDDLGELPLLPDWLVIAIYVGSNVSGLVALGLAFALQERKK